MWLPRLALDVPLIPGTASPDHVRQNLAAEDVTLDENH